MDIKKKLELVRRNTAEILTEDDLRKVLEKKSPKAYYGVAPTGPFHMGYFIPMAKLLDFSKCGISNKILIADIHGALDDLKSKWDELDLKSEYYKKCIELGFPWEERPRFVRGSSFQFKEDYQNDLLKMSTLVTVSRSVRAASEVTRMKNPKVSELIYPLMQALDEEYLKVDIQLGGIDQRHIVAMAREFLPKIGYNARVEVMTPLIVSLKGPGVKMSASQPETSLKVYESEESLKKKIGKAYCPVGNVKDNPIVQLFRYIIFPVKGKLKIERDKKFGGDVSFSSYEEFEKAYVGKKLHPVDVKSALVNEFTNMFSRARSYFDLHTSMLKDLGNDFI